MNSRRCLLLRSATTAQHKMVPIKSIYSSYILTVSVYFDISHVTNRSECVCCSYATVYELRMSASGELCRICTDNPDCRRCHRRLPPHCLKATAIFAERVGESTQTTCVALPSAVWSGKLSGLINRGTSTSQCLSVITQSTS